jgi:MFS family permease
MLWGAVLALHAACKNFAGLVTVRTFLGVFEACCQPIFIVLSSMWYKREEQAQTVAYWYMMNGGQQIVGMSQHPSRSLVSLMLRRWFVGICLHQYPRKRRHPLVAGTLHCVWRGLSLLGRLCIRLHARLTDARQMFLGGGQEAAG